jgi:ketosteroid isomerase-like protein
MTRTFSAAEQELIDVNRDRIAALVACDLDALDRFVAHDMQYVSVAGAVQTKAQVFAGFRSGDVRLERQDPSELDVRIYGDAAIVGYRADSLTLDRGARIEGTTRCTSVYARRDGRWQQSCTQASRRQVVARIHHSRTSGASTRRPFCPRANYSIWGMVWDGSESRAVVNIRRSDAARLSRSAPANEAQTSPIVSANKMLSYKFVTRPSPAGIGVRVGHPTALARELLPDGHRLTPPAPGNSLPEYETCGAGSEHPARRGTDQLR